MEEITVNIDFKAVERKNIAAQYVLIHDKEPTKKQLNEFIIKNFPDHNTKDFSKMENRLQKALSNEILISHKIGNEYQMDGKKDKWKIAYYPIFEDGKTNEIYEEPRALVEKNILGKYDEKIGTDFREVPLRYLTRCDGV